MRKPLSIFIIILAVLQSSCSVLKRNHQESKEIYRVQFRDVSSSIASTEYYTIVFEIDAIIDSKREPEPGGGELSLVEAAFTKALINELTTGERLAGRDGYSSHYVLKAENRSFILTINKGNSFDLRSEDGFFSVSSIDHPKPVKISFKTPLN